MLTCVIGKKKVNAFEIKEDKLRKYSRKGILKCPVCGESLIYKNGEIVSAHFAHRIDSNCNFGQTEPETEEHSLGKKYLYKWLKKQYLINDVELEYWMPEIKLRPDLWFKDSNGKEYCIEYQCSPTALQHIQSKNELYRLNNVEPIWIFGTQRISNRSRLYDYLGNVYRLSPSDYLFVKNGVRQNIKKRNNFYIEGGVFYLNEEIRKEFYGLLDKFNGKLDYQKLLKDQERQYQNLVTWMDLDKKIDGFTGKSGNERFIDNLLRGKFINDWKNKTGKISLNFITSEEDYLKLKPNLKIINYGELHNLSVVKMAYLIDRNNAWNDSLVHFYFSNCDDKTVKWLRKQVGFVDDHFKRLTINSESL